MPVLLSMIDAAMAMSGNRSGVVTRQLMVTGRHHRLYHGCGGNRSELVLEAEVSMDWSSSCVIKEWGLSWCREF